MKKKVIAVILTCILGMSLVGCGFESYTCYKCDKTTRNAYYEFSMSKDCVMCEECARKYWGPFSIENFKVN